MSRDDFEWPEEEEYPRQTAEDMVASFDIKDYVALKEAITLVAKTLQNSDVDNSLLLENTLNFLEKCNAEKTSDKIRLVCLALILSQKKILHLHEELTKFYFIAFTEEDGALKKTFRGLEKTRAPSYYAEVKAALDRISTKTDTETAASWMPNLFGASGQQPTNIVADVATAIRDQVYDATIKTGEWVYASAAATMKVVSDTAINTKKKIDDALCAAMKKQFFPKVARITEKPADNESKKRSPTI